MAGTNLEFLYAPQARAQHQGRHSDSFLPMMPVSVATTLENPFSSQEIPCQGSNARPESLIYEAEGIAGRRSKTKARDLEKISYVG